MGDIKINEKLIFSQTGSDEPVLASNVTFPAGSVLQVVRDKYNSQTEASSQIKVCDVELTAKQANSKFYYNFCTLLGGYNDPDNVDIRITKTAGSTPINTDYLPADNRGPGSYTQSSGAQIYCDVQVQSAHSGHVGYVVSTWGAADLILSTHAKDAVLSFAVWIGAVAGCWINRSHNRADQESGITALTIFEIGV